ncbi:MAG: TfoX/Sxy family protein [Planctomycetota bacterium]
MARSARDGFADHVLDQLRELDSLAGRSMFGGTGLYADSRFFGIIYRSQLFLKVDDESRLQYVARGSAPFKPNNRQTMKSYYEVPAEVLDSRDQLLAWARRAVQAAPAR